MLVTLKWLQAKADRYIGQTERRDYSTDQAIIDQWCANGWCEIVDRERKAPKAVDRAVTDVPRKRGPGRPKKGKSE